MATEFDPLMHAIRSNCIRFAENLRTKGFVFAEPPISAPRADTAATFAMLDSGGASMPSALRAFYEIVGAIEFTGRPPSAWRGCDYPDPISIVPLDAQYWRGEMEAWQEEPSEAFNELFAPQIAGDRIHKAGYSGAGYHIIFDDADDPTFWMPDGQMRFTEYLNLCLAWGGFPGLRNCPSHAWPLEQIKEGITSSP